MLKFFYHPTVEEIVKALKRISPLDLVYDQFQQLKAKLKTTGDAAERKILLRRLVNLVGVIQFLLAMNKST